VIAALQYGGTQAPPWLFAYIIADHFHIDPMVVRKTWPLAEIARAFSYLRNLKRD
jgi:hypothetical protein